MSTLGNLPPGVDDADIDRSQGDDRVDYFDHEDKRMERREQQAEDEERLAYYKGWTFDPHFSDGSMHDYELPIDDDEEADE